MIRLLAISSIIFLVFQCGGKKAAKEFSFKDKVASSQSKTATIVDLENKGVGPVLNLELTDLDSVMVSQGKSLFDEKCTACHKIGSTYIGPSPTGVLQRRSPEWVMNMILNPDEMLKKDPLAKALFMEFNGQLMTNQHLDENEARAILEYFRTL